MTMASSEVDVDWPVLSLALARVRARNAGYP